MTCQYPRCECRPSMVLLGAEFCVAHYDLVSARLRDEIRRLISAVTDDESPPVSNGMCKGVRHERDS